MMLNKHDNEVQALRLQVKHTDGENKANLL